MNILVVDDEEGIREIVIEKLTRVGVTSVAEAASVDEAKAILESNVKFDLIISDYKMNDGHGGDLLNYTYEKNFKTPFVFFTSTMQLSIPQNLDKNFLGVIDKSDFKKLLNLVKEKLQLKGCIK